VLYQQHIRCMQNTRTNEDLAFVLCRLKQHGVVQNVNNYEKELLLLLLIGYLQQLHGAKKKNSQTSLVLLCIEYRICGGSSISSNELMRN
jgi:hypothetical protein